MRVPAVHAAATSLDPPGRGADSPRPPPHTHTPAGGTEHVQGLLAVRLQSGLGVLRLVKAIVYLGGKVQLLHPPGEALTIPPGPFLTLNK